MPALVDTNVVVHHRAYAEHFGLEALLSEDFQDGRLYGSVAVRNPFA